MAESSSSSSHQNQKQATEPESINQLPSSPGSQQTLSDMSLLELSLNNADSLFGTNNNGAAALSSTPMNQMTSGGIINPMNSNGEIMHQNERILLPSDDNGGGGDVDGGGVLSSSSSSAMVKVRNLEFMDSGSNMSSQSGFAGLSSASKLLRNFSSFLNENSISLSGILSSLYVHKSSEHEGKFIYLVNFFFIFL